MGRLGRCCRHAQDACGGWDLKPRLSAGCVQRWDGLERDTPPALTPYSVTVAPMAWMAIPNRPTPPPELAQPYAMRHSCRITPDVMVKGAFDDVGTSLNADMRAWHDIGGRVGAAGDQRR
jgi:hypothetical protein